MLKLTENKVAIQAIFDKERTKGGIWIPDVAQDRCDQGIVKYIGPKVKDVKVGDYVLFGGYDGTTVRLEGEGILILMRESAVKCVIESAATEVKGLYLKEKPNAILAKELIDMLGYHIENTITVDEVVNKILNLINKHSPYFPATHESIIDILSSQQEPIEYKNKYHQRESIIEEEDEE